MVQKHNLIYVQYQTVLTFKINSIHGHKMDRLNYIEYLETDILMVLFNIMALLHLV